jgi:hypothetical protein
MIDLLHAGHHRSGLSSDKGVSRETGCGSVEHVFATEKRRMGLVVRSTGLARATARITLANLAYNMRRLVWIEGRAAPALGGRDGRNEPNHQILTRTSPRSHTGRHPRNLNGPAQLYRPRLVRHRVEGYAALAAG